jgi:hypothetical protein
MMKRDRTLKNKDEIRSSAIHEHNSVHLQRSASTPLPRARGVA